MASIRGTKTKQLFDLLIQKQPDNRRGWKAERCQVIEILSAFGEMPLKGRKNIFWKRAACDGIKGSNKFIYLKNIAMQVIYEKIVRRPNYEIFIDFRCISNGLDIVTFGTVQMVNVDYDKHLTTSVAKIDSEEDADNVMFSSLPDEVYDYIDEQVEAIKDNVFDDLF